MNTKTLVVSVAMLLVFAFMPGTTAAGFKDARPAAGSKSSVFRNGISPDRSRGATRLYPDPSGDLSSIGATTLQTLKLKVRIS